MNSIEAIRNYKHDIIGKFNDIQLVVKDFTEHSFKDQESIELLLAVHETLIKMIHTSKSVVESQVPGEIVLRVSKESINEDMPVLMIGGVKIRCGLNEYWYSLRENDEKNIDLVKLLLPIHKVVYAN